MLKKIKSALLKTGLVVAILFWHDFCHIWVGKRLYFMIPIVIIISFYSIIKAFMEKNIYRSGVWLWVFFYASVNFIVMAIYH